MGKFIIIIFFTIFSYASSILNVSYFPSSDKLDILLSLDTPFKGKISKIKTNDYKISGVSFNRIEQKKFNNGLNVIISAIDNNDVELKILDKRNIFIKASITAKGYGLRLRLLGIQNITQKNNEFTMKNVDNNQMLNNSDNNGFNFINYIIVIIILIILIIILLIVKKKALQKLPKELQQDNYKVLYQKMIDPKNKLVLIDVFNRRYLLLLGDKNNLLLDNFSQDNQDELKDVSTQNGFESLLDDKLKKDEYMKKASELKGLE